MPVTGFNHVNIRTLDIAASAQFYVDIFGFEYRQGPVLAGGHRPNWLHDREGRAIIHLRKLEADSPSTGPIDHIALNCEGKAEILERLKARDIDYTVSPSMIPGVTQIFLKDPHGVPLELQFEEE